MSLKISIKNLNLTELGKEFRREIDSVPGEITVEELISRISNELNISDPTLIDILFRGQILNRSQSFQQYMNPNSSNEADIYLVKNVRRASKNDKPTTHEIYTLVNALNSIFRSRTKKNYLEVFLQDNRRVNEVLAPLPAIKNDPIAYGFVQNYDLVKYLIDQKRAESILQSNGNIYQGVKLIIEHIREFSKKNPVDEKFISKRSYTIDDASEDEQEQARSSNQHQQQQAMRAATAAAAAGPAISQDHFAAVLAMLNQQQQAQRGAATSFVPPLIRPASNQPPAQAQPQQPSPQLFDRNQFQSLMQQIMSQQQPQQQQQQQQPQQQSQPSSSNTAPPQQQQQQPSISSELAAKLDQMHEFGFFDDAVNLRALEITEGNVEAAISLIIEGGDMI